ncbi:hypothetical protein ACLKA7_014550 [Drosophila subpalustris]
MALPLDGHYSNMRGETAWKLWWKLWQKRADKVEITQQQPKNTERGHCLSQPPNVTRTFQVSVSPGEARRGDGAMGQRTQSQCQRSEGDPLSSARIFYFLKVKHCLLHSHRIVARYEDIQLELHKVHKNADIGPKGSQGVEGIQHQWHLHGHKVPHRLLVALCAMPHWRVIGASTGY